MLTRVDQEALRALVGLAQREYEQLVLAERLRNEARVPLISPASTERAGPESKSRPSDTATPRKPR